MMRGNGVERRVALRSGAALLAASCVVASLAASRPARAEDAPPPPPKREDPADTKPPRLPLPRDTRNEPPPTWRRYADLGADIAVITRSVSHDGAGQLTGARLRPALGFGVHGRMQMLKYLGFTGYYVSGYHTLLLPEGSLARGGLIDSPSVRIYEFGARLMPMLPIRDRARVWVTGGVGWGQAIYPAFNAVPGVQKASLRERSDSFASIPFGFGASVDVIARWLTLEVEGTFAFPTGQGGSASTSVQAVDDQGNLTHVGPLPKLDMTFVQTLGLSIIL